MAMAFGAFLRVALLFAAASAPVAPEPYAMAWSTFLGGGGYERAQGCAVDAGGFISIVGNMNSSDLPATPGAFQRTYAGDDPVGVLSYLFLEGEGHPLGEGCIPIPGCPDGCARSPWRRSE